LDEKEREDIAIFRFSAIAPLVNGFYKGTNAQYYRELAEKGCQRPDGKTVFYSPKTVKGWFEAYSKGGLPALYPVQSRSDLGSSKVLNEEALKAISQYKLESPHITGTSIHKRLLDDGLLPNGGCLASVLRYLRLNDMNSQSEPADRRAFEMEHCNDLWQIDTSHGPRIGTGESAKKTYLVSILDDKSRALVGSEYYYNDTEKNVMHTLKNAIFIYGCPQALYLDNGASYIGRQLRYATATLGIQIIHCRPYTPESKGYEQSFLMQKSPRKSQGFSICCQIAIH
jgi:transposase InsO family protein